jgi:hypothetical protein
MLGARSLGAGCASGCGGSVQSSTTQPLSSTPVAQRHGRCDCKGDDKHDDTRE